MTSSGKDNSSINNCNIIIEINNEKEYEVFFEKYTNGIELKPEYKNKQFLFRIYPNKKEKRQFADEQLLFFYFIIANCYGKSHFSVEVDLDRYSEDTQTGSNKEGDFYRYLIFSLIQTEIEGLRGNICLNSRWRPLDNTEREKNTLSLEVGRIFPALTINYDTYKILQTPISENLWKNIEGNNILHTGSPLLNMLIRLCRRYLFTCPDESNVYREIRQRTFRSPDFYRLIEGIPIFTLVLFSEVDYYSRRDMLAELRKKISGNITLRELLEDYQEEQTYEKYQAHITLLKEGINNKSLLLRRNDAKGKRYEAICKKLDSVSDSVEEGDWTQELYNNYGLHPQIVAEIYEAISISEGIFQLLDNIVLHAGCGLLSIRMHDVTGNTPLKDRYPEYFDKYDPISGESRTEHSIHIKYFLEIRIGDISGTNIADKFKENNHEFGNSLQDTRKDIYDGFQLKTFFDPLEQEKSIWDEFYSQAGNIVNHYGLQIFDSILNSKNGYFKVVSGAQCYQNIPGADSKNGVTSHIYPGTVYTILLPMHNRVSEDKNIYDSMLLYGADESLAQLLNSSCDDCDFEGMERPEVEGRAAYFQAVHQKIGKAANNHNLIVIDMDKVDYLEGIVKGVLSYLFSDECQCKKENLYIAFINCKAYQIIEVVRLVSLSYDKAGLNRRMERTQIFIRGKEIGEEILFYGNTLSDVSKNIMKIACMRGILYDNYQTVDALLNRK